MHLIQPFGCRTTYWSERLFDHGGKQGELARMIMESKVGSERGSEWQLLNPMRKLQQQQRVFSFMYLGEKSVASVPTLFIARENSE